MSLPEFEIGATYTGTFIYVERHGEPLSNVVLVDAVKTRGVAKDGEWVRNLKTKEIRKVTREYSCWYDFEGYNGSYLKYYWVLLTSEELREHQAKEAEAKRKADEAAEIERQKQRKSALNDYTIAELIEAAAEKAKTTSNTSSCVAIGTGIVFGGTSNTAIGTNK